MLSFIIASNKKQRNTLKNIPITVNIKVVFWVLLFRPIRPMVKTEHFHC